MERFAPYLGIIAALSLGAFIVALSSTSTFVAEPQSSVHTASSSVSVVAGTTSPTTQVLKENATTTATSSTPAPKKIALPAPAPKTIPPKTTTLPPVPTAPVQPVAVAVAPNVGFDVASALLRGALVNILCFAPTGSTLHSITGSGVIVDSKGIILTNAHIAQYFLLADRNVTCTIRSGSPAADKYAAALIYISPVWVHANANILTAAQPTGTGEYDFAFLAITKSVTSTPLPTSFPFIPLATVAPEAQTPVVLASYGAQFLETAQVQSDLFPTVVFGSVKNIYTFKTNTIDIIALGGSAAAQEGSSGGGVADASGKLVGTITTSTVEGSTDTRLLNAITASYVRSEYASETSSALDLLLAKPTAFSVSDFAPQIPSLEAILTAQLQ